MGNNIKIKTEQKDEVKAKVTVKKKADITAQEFLEMLLINIKNEKNKDLPKSSSGIGGYGINLI